MTSFIQHYAGRLTHTTRDWLAARRDESRRCADCDAEVSPWDDICPACGLQCPARVNISWLVFLGVAGVCLLVITLLAFYE